MIIAEIGRLVLQLPQCTGTVNKSVLIPVVSHTSWVTGKVNLAPHVKGKNYNNSAALPGKGIIWRLYLLACCIYCGPGTVENRDGRELWERWSNPFPNFKSGSTLPNPFQTNVCLPCSGICLICARSRKNSHFQYCPMQWFHSLRCLALLIIRIKSLLH